jgi:prepilin signal peptidase PulO-like enzyme (type II secretory pathway)
MLYFFLFFSFLLGAVIGSFANCFIWRLHENETLWDRSYCPKCRKQIAWHDNIPIFSFLFLGGRCRKCKKNISWQYPLVEFFMACLFTLSFYFVFRDFLPGGFSSAYFYLIPDNRFVLALVKDWLIIFTAIVIFVYDARWYLIPDRVVVPASLILLILNLFLGFSWLALLLGALIGGGFFLLQFLVSQGRWVGGGDIRLGLLLGLAIGKLDLLILSLVLTYFLGAIIGSLLVLFGKKHFSSRVPLGVFLTPALLISIFWGGKIMAWYYGLYW